MRQFVPALFLVGIAAGACADPAGPVQASPPDQVADSVSVPATDGVGPATEVRLNVASDFHPMAFVGNELAAYLQVVDGEGRTISPEDAVVTLSDPALAGLQASPLPIIVNGVTHEYTFLRLTFLGAGELRLVARLGDLVDTLSISVQPRPPVTDALRIESLSLVEYLVSCAFECGYVAYAPVLKLDVPADAAPPTLIRARVSLGGKRTTCGLAQSLAPGGTYEIGRVHPYLYDNGLLFVSFDGERLTGDSATIELFVRLADGSLGTVEATGPVLRHESSPAMPGESAAYWEC